MALNSLYPETLVDLYDATGLDTSCRILMYEMIDILDVLTINSTKSSYKIALKGSAMSHGKSVAVSYPFDTSFTPRAINHCTFCSSKTLP